MTAAALALIAFVCGLVIGIRWTRANQPFITALDHKIALDAANRRDQW